MRLLFYFVPLFLLLLNCLFATAVKNITTDQSALLAFKLHVSDPRGVLVNNWSISYPVCNWVGITCGARHRRVVAFYLSDMGLGGTIPPHLGNLSFLVYLNISHNNFHGHLPNELGQLRRLRVISLTNNELIGSIPSWIGALSKLRYLFLQNNSFIGPIPDSLFNLSRLQNLDIMYNMIDASIPSRIGNLSRLMNLNFGYNNLQGMFASTSISSL